MHFILFVCIRDRLVALRNSVKKRAELVQKFVPRSRVELFATNAPDPTHWNLNVLVHFVLFVCIRDRLTKLGAKRADVVQKFVPRSRVGIFLQRTHPIHPIAP